MPALTKVVPLIVIVLTSLISTLIWQRDFQQILASPSCKGEVKQEFAPSLNELIKPEENSKSITTTTKLQDNEASTEPFHDQDEAAVATAVATPKEKPFPSSTSCAILFIGLPRSYQSLVLPSIARNVIPYNPNCDYYVHTYNKTQEAKSRSGAGGKIDPNDIFLLRDAVMNPGSHYYNNTNNSRSNVTFLLETEEEFFEARGPLLEKIFTERDEQGQLVYVPARYKNEYPNITVGNIVKQWHSIESAWQLMERAEQARGQKYTTVAVLRSDVMFVTPIQVQQANTNHHQVTVPGFALYPVNDRLIYGDRAGVEIWASQRFSRLDEHINRPAIRNHGMGMHPEKFLYFTIFPAIGQANYTIEDHPSLCLLRSRADDVVWANDCFDPTNEEPRSKVTPVMKANYEDKNMKALVEQTLGRQCAGKEWNNQIRELHCPPPQITDSHRISKTETTTEKPRTSPQYTLTYENFLLQTKFNPPPVPSNHSNLDGCLIHVGKTAGSTISCVVGNIKVPTCLPGSNQSQSFAQYRDGSALAQIIGHTGTRNNWRHLRSNQCHLNPQKKHLAVTTVRDPIARIISAFNYEKKECSIYRKEENLRGCKSFFRDCHQDFEALAASGLKEFFNDQEARSLPANSLNMTCSQRAWAYVTGIHSFWKINHHWHNYEFYFNYVMNPLSSSQGKSIVAQPIDLALDSLPASPVVVLRSERLVQDWDSIDTLLGGTGTMGHEIFATHLNPSTKQALSEEALGYLCSALCMEIQYYKLMLWWSSNLNAIDIEWSMDILRQSCPEEPSSIRRCNSGS